MFAECGKATLLKFQTYELKLVQFTGLACFCRFGSSPQSSSDSRDNEDLNIKIKKPLEIH